MYGLIKNKDEVNFNAKLLVLLHMAAAV